MTLLTKHRTTDGEIIAKARHMLRRRSVERVSDYLEICPHQVARIHATLPKGIKRGRPPKVPA